MGARYGPASNKIDAEAIVKLDIALDRAFGLTLRNDESFASHQKMFEIMRLIRLELHLNILIV